MKNKVFFSLNAKIFLFLFLSVSAIFALFLSTFMISYVRQLDQEAVAVHKKATKLYELYTENEYLRSMINHMQKEQNISDNSTFSKIWAEQGYDFTLKPQEERLLDLRKELLADIKNSRNRNEKVRMLMYFILFAFLLVFFLLELLWLIVRRWILRPLEQLLDATHHLSSGDLDFRLPVSRRFFENDELNILSRDFNKMAEDIQSYIRNIDENKTFLQNLIDSVPDGIRVIDENYNIILTNDTYNKMYQGINDKKKCFEFYGNSCPCSAMQHPCVLALLKENPNKTINVIQRHVLENGRERFLEVSAAASYRKVKDKNILRVIELIRPMDKTILLSHQQKLSTVGLLASSVAHEMRNPLGSVRLILENILDRMDGDPLKQKDLKHYLSLVNEQISICINVTSRLLKLSKKPEKESHPVDFNEVVSETASLLEYEAKKTGVEISIQEADKPAVVLASDAEMRMVVVNLMQNAFHALPNGGKIGIKVHMCDGKVRVDISDTGIGIEPENISRIFEPFFSKNSEKNQNEGTGLGLSIVKTIVESYNGVISVESELGKGAVFHLDFDEFKE